MSPALTFLGAAGTVTGSQHFLEDEGRRLFMDCGLFQRLKPLRERNWAAPRVDPRSLPRAQWTQYHI